MNDLPQNPELPSAYAGAIAAVPASPGAALAAAREGRGLTIEQVASQLNLAPRQVLALETDNFSALPGMVIARGFLRAYAKLLSLDPQPLLAGLGDASQASHSVPMRHALSTSFSESRLPSLHSNGPRSRLVPAMAGLAVLLAAAAASFALGWWPEAMARRIGQIRANAGFGTDSSRGTGPGLAAEGNASADAGTGNPTAITTTDSVATAAAEMPAAAGAAVATPILDAGGKLSSTLGASRSSTPTAAVPGNTTAVQPGPVSVNAMSASLSQPASPATSKPAGVPGSNSLVLDFAQDSWVELKQADNTVLVAKVIKAGSVATFEVVEPSTLIIGNIAGVKASLRGAPLELAKSANGNVAKLRLK